MSQDQRSEAALSRFASPIRLAVSRVLKDRDQEDDYYLRDELEQLARIHVITYAGLMPGWQNGKLKDWTRQAEGDEEQIRLLVANQLRLALTQDLSRQGGDSASLDVLLEYGLEPIDYDLEERMIERIDNRAAEADYRSLYPTLSRNVLDGMTQAEIAAELEVGHSTVERRIAKEKRAFLLAYAQRRGLRTEGDETLDQLAEAYGYLTAGQYPPLSPGLAAA